MRGQFSPTGAAEEEDPRPAPHTSDLHPEEDRTSLLNHSAVSMRPLKKKYKSTKMLVLGLCVISIYTLNSV